MKIISVFLLFFCTSPVYANSNVKKLFLSFAGYQPSYKSNEFKKVKSLLNKNKKSEALDYIMSLEQFYSVKLFKLANKMLTPNDDLYTPLNDMSAMLIGIAKSDEDFRSLLTGDFLYIPDYRVYSYDDFDRSNSGFSILSKIKNYTQYLNRRSPQWDIQNSPVGAGILGTRSWAKLYYSAGTNRRAVKAAFNAFLCTDIEQWRDKTVEGSWIRQDVTRTPGGEARVFQNRCKSCHAPMDALAGAFAYLNYQNRRIKFSSRVQKKYIQNSDVFSQGYITLDNSWENLVTKNHNKKFKFIDTFGKGVEAFSKMFATSEGFPVCMSKRVFESVCSKEIKLTNQYLEELAAEFKNKKFNIKSIFKKVGLDEKCN